MPQDEDLSKKVFNNDGLEHTCLNFLEMYTLIRAPVLENDPEIIELRKRYGQHIKEQGCVSCGSMHDHLEKYYMKDA